MVSHTVAVPGNGTSQQSDPPGGWTEREILQQPDVWRQIARAVLGDQALAALLAPELAASEVRIVLTGAGTSAYIGQCLAPALSRRRSGGVEAIATTDIVADPAATLIPDAPTLMVHFARSGNSPESVAALDLAERRIRRCCHLIVTCNPQGALVQRVAGLRRAYALVLPDACNDRSLAMTSSFSGMLLAAGLALRAFARDPASVDEVAALVHRLLEECRGLVQGLVAKAYERVVYLGSKELAGFARESALKLLELTDGRVVSVGESALAFRHGPKSLVNAKTLVVLFVSNDPYTRQYDLDLLGELRRESVAGRVLALSGTPALALDGTTIGPAGHAPLSDLALGLAYVGFAQWYALQCSMSLGLTPDTPNTTGTVHRVVQGVSIHPFKTP